jgi:hypothetical protein
MACQERAWKYTLQGWENLRLRAAVQTPKWQDLRTFYVLTKSTNIVLLQNALTSTLRWETHLHCPLLSSSSTILHLSIHLEHHLHFIMLLKKFFEVSIINFVKSSNLIFIVYYFSQYLHLDVR